MVHVASFAIVGGRARLTGLLLLAALIRLPQINAPLADNLQVKQVYVSNKARSIARAPMDPFRNTLDFLDEQGKRLTLTEEVPIYTGLLGLAYRFFGERDWVGRTLSLIGTLLAIAAYADLTRREYGQWIADVGAFLLAVAPLLVFYGRAVMPDSWMLAAMLIACACYRRHLDTGGRAWLFVAACAAALAPLFKYFGVMILIPLAGMTVHCKEHRDRRALRFLVMSTATILPVGLWMFAVFLRTANPVASGWSGDGKATPYLLIQTPSLLLSPNLYSKVWPRFLLRDCGAVMSALMVWGLVAAVKRRWETREGRPSLQPLLCWSVMCAAFCLMFAPKLLDHDYYELMLLPAVATWGAMGLARLLEWFTIQGARRIVVIAGVLMLAAAVQSPWSMPDMFRIDRGKLILAARLKARTDLDRRVVVIGPGIELPTIVHYSDREGWALRMGRLPENWPARLASFRAAGAQILTIYFDSIPTANAQSLLEAATDKLPLLEHGTGPWSKTAETCSYWIFDLRSPTVSGCLRRSP
jgi:Dolichyl-phosphate-mannose-protein mannosyltransferase